MIAVNRPHPGLENKLIGAKAEKRSSKSKTQSDQSATISLADIQCKQRLGGLLSSYRGKAA